MLDLLGWSVTGSAREDRLPGSCSPVSWHLELRRLVFPPQLRFLGFRSVRRKQRKSRQRKQYFSNMTNCSGQLLDLYCCVNFAQQSSLVTLCTEFLREFRFNNFDV